MFYIVSNSLAFLISMIVAIVIKSQNRLNRNSNQLMFLVIKFAFLFLGMALTITLNIFNNIPVFSINAARVTFTLIFCFGIEGSFYLIHYPNEKFNLFHNLTKWIIEINAIYVMFFAPNIVTDVIINNQGVFQIVSSPAFNGLFDKFIVLSKFDLMIVVYNFLIPLITVLMVGVKVEYTDSRIVKQSLLLNIFGVVFAWLGLLYIYLSCKYSPMMMGLICFAYVAEVLFFINANAAEQIWDVRSVLSTTIYSLAKYIVPALLFGLSFVILYPLYGFSKFLFYFLYLGIMIGVSIVVRIGEGHLNNLGLRREQKITKSFESELLTMDYDEGSEAINKKIFSLFEKYVDSSSMKVLVETEDNIFNTVYSSNEETAQVELDEEVTKTLARLDEYILFTEFVNKNTEIHLIRSKLIKMMKDAKADAIIIIQDKGKILAIVFLGKKKNGTLYSDYDLTVFNRVYTNLYVYGYYVKNIMRQEMNGTPVHDIRQSGEIIRGVQETMDPIAVNNVQLGDIVESNQIISSQYVDSIRLSKKKYIFVLGDFAEKGINSSVNMVIIKSIIRTYLSQTTDFKVLIQMLNKFIYENFGGHVNFSCMIGLIDFTEDAFYYINCGLPNMIHYSRSKNMMKELTGENFTLGIQEKLSSDVKLRRVKLYEKDIIVACNNGLYKEENIAGVQYDKDSVMRRLERFANLSAQEISKNIISDCKSFTSKELEQDISILTIKYIEEGLEADGFFSYSD